MVIPCLCLFRLSSCTAHHKTAVIPVDIPMRWEPRAKQQQRVAFADFSAAPWQGFEKSERGPSLGSLFPPQAAVASAAVRVLCRHHEKSPQTKGLAASFLVDIPTGWEPRAKQQPTGLIAYSADWRRQSRPVRVLYRPALTWVSG